MLEVSKDRVSTLIAGSVSMQSEARNIAQKIQQGAYQESLRMLAAFLRSVPAHFAEIRKFEKSVNKQDEDSDKALYTIEVITEEIGEAIETSDWILLGDLLEFEYVQALEKSIARLQSIAQECICPKQQ